MQQFDALKDHIVAGLVYGSYQRDIDILILVEDSDIDRLNRIKRILEIISQEENKPVDPDIKTLEDFSNRVRCQDYYIWSVLNTTRFYICGEDVFVTAKNDIISRIPDENSIMFNLREGLSILDFAHFMLRCFEFLLRESLNYSLDLDVYKRAVLNQAVNDCFSTRPELLYYINQAVRNGTFSISYLAAVRRMVKGRLVNFNYLCSNPPELHEDFLFRTGKDLIEEYKNGREIKYSAARDFLSRVSLAYEKFNF